MKPNIYTIIALKEVKNALKSDVIVYYNIVNQLDVVKIIEYLWYVLSLFFSYSAPFFAFLPPSCLKIQLSTSRSDVKANNPYLLLNKSELL
jgi:hypothetical protein